MERRDIITFRDIIKTKDELLEKLQDLDLPGSQIRVIIQELLGKINILESQLEMIPNENDEKDPVYSGDSVFLIIGGFGEKMQVLEVVNSKLLAEDVQKFFEKFSNFEGSVKIIKMEVHKETKEFFEYFLGHDYELESKY